MAYDLSPSLDELKSVIRKAGLRSTSPRIAVLRRLSVASTPISHGELVEVLASDGMDRTTIYRNLVDLTEVGLVSRTDLGDHVWRFELKRGTGNGDDARHPHFTCSDCGAVSCLPEVTLKVKQGKGVPRALTQQKVEIQLRGQCDACAA
ncbi:MAG: transcriptional repressor [Myxococcales bacterium]|nr:transcriptional repressor [Myxococcales bacterium]MDP3504717.1 transcriptional repressor [Myxococcales bacterium]